MPGSAGFVLLEVMVGLSLLAIGIVAAMGALRSSLRVSGTSEAIREATVILEERLEAIAANPPMVVSSAGEQDGFHWQVELQSFDAWTEHLASVVARGELSALTPQGKETLDRLGALRDMKVAHVRVEWQERGRTRFVEARQALSVSDAEILWEQR
jgi:type II secretory pathway component PulJ